MCFSRNQRLKKRLKWDKLYPSVIRAHLLHSENSMIHEDLIPFLVLLAVAVVAGFAGKEKGENVGLVLFCLGGLLPLISYISIAGKLPISSTLEMGAFFSAIPLFVSGSYFSKRKGGVFFWIAAIATIIIAALINLMIIGLLRIPV